MARPGVGSERIVEVIKELEIAGREPTATAVRERLGSGSYSTIAAVLTDWRRDKASETRTPTPEPPDAVRQLLIPLWSEAWKAATSVHEPERQAFVRERQEHERTKAEMIAEIARLEDELTAERETTARTVEALEGQLKTLTHDQARHREEKEALKASLATAEGALAEARKQVAREEERNRELSERVIAEAAKAQALAAQRDQGNKGHVR